MTSGLNEIQRHARTERKARKRQICSDELSKTKNKGRETVKTTRRGSDIARGQGTQQEDKRNIRTGEMNGNKWRGKPAQNKRKKPATVGEEL